MLQDKMLSTTCLRRYEAVEAKALSRSRRRTENRQHRISSSSSSSSSKRSTSNPGLAPRGWLCVAAVSWLASTHLLGSSASAAAAGAVSHQWGTRPYATSTSAAAAAATAAAAPVPARGASFAPALECFDASRAGCDWLIASSGNGNSGEDGYGGYGAIPGIPGGWKASHTGSSDHQHPVLATIVSVVCLVSVILFIIVGPEQGWIPLRRRLTEEEFHGLLRGSYSY
jgi:hypothetical protein